MDLSKLSDDDLRALSKGDYASISDKGLKLLSNEPDILVKRKEPEAQVDYEFSETAKNFLPSMYRAGENLVSAIAHPIDTATNLGNVIAGYGQKAFDIFGKDKVPYANAMNQAFENRYGSVNALKRTAMQDPAGMMLDASAVLGGAGALAKAPRVAGFGRAIDPINLAIKTPYAALKAYRTHVTPNAAINKYMSAAKFSKGRKVSQADRRGWAETALRNQLMPTEKGVEKLVARKQMLANKIHDHLMKIESEGERIPGKRVLAHIDDLKKEVGGFKWRAKSDLDAIDKAVSKFKEHIEKTTGKPFDEVSITPSQMQEFKIDIYNQINWDKQAMAGRTAENRAMKEAARAAKESIEELHPEIKKTNQQLGNLIELEPQLRAATSRIADRDIMGIGVPIKLGAGAAFDNPVASAAGGISALQDIPKLKALQALRIYKLQNLPYRDLYSTSPYAWAGRQIPIQAGRINGLLESQ